MHHLHAAIATRVDAWRAAGYPCATYPALAEVLAFQRTPHGLRHLRPPQLRALETYWYLRLVEGTPKIADLYAKHFPTRRERIQALGIPTALAAEYDLDELLGKIRSDHDFVDQHDLEALAETLNLAYPSYILALAMGAGKTQLIGAIIASEFALAQEYPGGDSPFIRNALVFAPGKTILPSLRELAAMPYDRILPPRLAKGFESSLKITFTRDGETGIPVVPQSSFNLVVTNTEKIRIQVSTGRRTQPGQLSWLGGLADERVQAAANLRLENLADLPALGVFSDEAHHTYGQSLLAGIKRVRQTIDYLAARTSLRCVINTTGTPYYENQPLRDVVVWYGLGQGIRDNILKSLDHSIRLYDRAELEPETIIREVVRDFFATYGEVRLPGTGDRPGGWAKLAIYLPQTAEVRTLRPVIDAALVAAGRSPAEVLVNTSDSALTSTADIEAFDRLNQAEAPHRVIVLVNKGTEGWNCPSLFACALIRELKGRNNFVLQAATRCLRQVPGNPHPGRIYLSQTNQDTLNQQLRETYGTTLDDLARQAGETQTVRLCVRKPDLPKLLVTRLRRRVVRKAVPPGPLVLTRPAIDQLAVRVTTATLSDDGARPIVRDGEGVAVSSDDGEDVLGVAVRLAGIYRLEAARVRDALLALYADGDIPAIHLPELTRQIEQAVSAYEIVEERVEDALALVDLAGFTPPAEPGGYYTTEITILKQRSDLIHPLRGAGAIGWHLDPYVFDSRPEATVYDRLLELAGLQSSQVRDIYFTGGITDPAQTDIRIEWRDAGGKLHHHTPDFLIHRQDGRWVIVEVKNPQWRESIEQAITAGAAPSSDEARKAVTMRRLADLNPERLQYRIVFPAEGALSADRDQQLQKACAP